jgi:predicted CopG family antitoxin
MRKTIDVSEDAWKWLKKNRGSESIKTLVDNVINKYKKTITSGAGDGHMTKERIERAISHAREMLAIYKSIPSGSIAASFIQRDIDAVEEGDHSEVVIRRLEDIQ